MFIFHVHLTTFLTAESLFLQRRHVIYTRTNLFMSFFVASFYPKAALILSGRFMWLKTDKVGINLLNYLQITATDNLLKVSFWALNYRLKSELYFFVFLTKKKLMCSVWLLLLNYCWIFAHRVKFRVWPEGGANPQLHCCKLYISSWRR